LSLHNVFNDLIPFLLSATTVYVDAVSGMHQSIDERNVLRLCLCYPARAEWAPAEMKDVLEPDVVAHNSRNAGFLVGLSSLFGHRLLLGLRTLFILSEAFAAVLFCLCVEFFVLRAERLVDCLRLIGPQVVSVVNDVMAQIDVSLPREKD